MKRLLMLLIATHLALVVVTPALRAEPAPVTMKMCMPSAAIVAYSGTCPAGTTKVTKLCPTGVEVGYSQACPKPTTTTPTPPPPVPTGPVAQPTRKLCMPSGTIIAYSAACPAGSTTQKVCPYGQIVTYTAACPKGPTELTYGGKARALSACPSIIYSAGDVLTVGTVYTVTGFGFYAPLGMDAPKLEVRDVVILNDATHRGDGAFALWVPVSCVVAS